MRIRYLLGYGIASLLLVIMFASLFVSYRAPASAVVVRNEITVDTPDGLRRSVSIPWYTVATPGGGFVPGRYRVVLDLAVPSGTIRSPILVLPFIGGSALEVRVNDFFIGFRGDPRDGESTIWNAAHVFPLPPEILRESTAVEITILGRYEAGLLRAPYVVDRHAARWRLFWLRFYSQYLVLALMGASALMGLITIGGSVAIPSSRLPRILVGVGTVLGAIILMDYALIESLPISFLLFKKIVVGSRHLAAAVLVAAAMGFLERPRDPAGRVFIVVQILCVLAIFLIPRDVITLKNVYSLTFYFFLPFLLYILVLTAWAVRSEERFGIIMFGILVAFTTSGLDVASMAFQPDRPFASHFGIVVLTLSAAVFVIVDLLKHYKLLVREQNRSRLFFEASLHDQLTGLYNRRALPLIAENLGPGYAVLAIDLDDFKRINDTYGHETGDAALRSTATIIQDSLRSGDFVVRVGGDEIAAILPNCSHDQALQLAERIEQTMRTSPVPGYRDLFCTASLGVSAIQSPEQAGYPELKAGLARADEALYAAKRAGKARVASAERPN